MPTEAGQRRPLVMRVLVLLLLGILGGLLTPGTASAAAAAAAAADTPEQDTVVYFYYGDGCPHCAEAEPFLADLAARHPGLEVRAYEVWHDDANRERLEAMAGAYRIDASGVPVIFIGEDAWVGFRRGATEGDIIARAETCLADGCPDPSTVRLAAGAPAAIATDRSDIQVPGVGRVELANKSLLVSTLLIAVVDGVNPCSLWVLTVLIAMSLRHGSRRRTLLVGGTFIAVTAMVYALFILGMFSVMTIVGFAPWIRVTVALVALTMALISIKDYFWFKKGVSLTIADDKKPGIYARMRRVLTQSDSVPALVGSTAVLAAGVSLVEFGCTAGFPVLWTNLLSAQEASVVTFLVLLLVYMLIYQLDEFAIFLTAVFTLRATRIQEKQGRVLKLVGGMLMLALAGTMIVDPGIMSTVTGSFLVFAGAGAAAALVLGTDRLVRGRVAA